MIHILLKIISVLLISYGISIAMVNSGTRFFFIWFVLGILLFSVSEAVRTGFLCRIPAGVLYSFAAVILAALILYGVIVIRIVGCFGERADNRPQYLIVLGAQVKDFGPSVVLRYRLDAAGAYMEDHREVKAVLCGGQGRNEPCTEAEAMRKYLSKVGQERLIAEDRSGTTAENFENSYKLIGDVPVAVVTNNFHMYRALILAREAGFTDVSGISAGSTPYYLPNNITREAGAIIKARLRRLFRRQG